MEARIAIKTRVGHEGRCLTQIPVDEDIFPRHKHFITNQNCIVFIKLTGKRVIKRAADKLRRHLVRGAANQFHARRIDGQDEIEGGFLFYDRASLGNQRVVRERGVCGNRFRAGHNNASICLTNHTQLQPVVGIMVLTRRVGNRVVQIQHAFLRFAIPAFSVLLIGVIKLGIRA